MIQLILRNVEYSGINFGIQTKLTDFAVDVHMCNFFGVLSNDGALYYNNSLGFIRIMSSSFVECKGILGSGCFYIYSGYCEIKSVCCFNGTNNGMGDLGTIYIKDKNLTMELMTYSGFVMAPEMQHVLFISEKKSYIESCNSSQNIKKCYSAISISECSVCSIKFSSFVYNSATKFRVCFFSQITSLEVHHCNIINNTEVDLAGGVVYIANSPNGIFDFCIFYKNTYFLFWANHNFSLSNSFESNLKEKTTFHENNSLWKRVLL